MGLVDQQELGPWDQPVHEAAQSIGLDPITTSALRSQ